MFSGGCITSKLYTGWTPTVRTVQCTVYVYHEAFRCRNPGSEPVSLYSNNSQKGI
jgi:hypothetical protein